MTLNTPPPASLSDPRVRFAAERTLLAWIRTGLALMGLGFVVARFGWFLRELGGREPQPSEMGGWSLGIGLALVSLGIVVNLASAVEHRRTIRLLDRGEPYRPPAWSLGILVAAVVTLLGVGMLGHLLRLATSQLAAKAGRVSIPTTAPRE